MNIGGQLKIKNCADAVICRLRYIDCRQDRGRLLKWHDADTQVQPRATPSFEFEPPSLESFSANPQRYLSPPSLSSCLPLLPTPVTTETWPLCHPSLQLRHLCINHYFTSRIHHPIHRHEIRGVEAPRNNIDRSLRRRLQLSSGPEVR